MLFTGSSAVPCLQSKLQALQLPSAGLSVWSRMIQQVKIWACWVLQNSSATEIWLTFLAFHTSLPNKRTEIIKRFGSIYVIMAWNHVRWGLGWILRKVCLPRGHWNRLLTVLSTKPARAQEVFRRFTQVHDVIPEGMLCRSSWSWTSTFLVGPSQPKIFCNSRTVLAFLPRTYRFLEQLLWDYLFGNFTSQFTFGCFWQISKTNTSMVTNML